MSGEKERGAGTPEEGSMRGALLRMAWPVLFQNMSHMAMFWVDTFMIGGLGPTALAAMGIVGSVCHMIASLLMAVTVGAVATVARAWGSKDREAQEREGAAALALGLLVGAPLSALAFFFLPRVAALFPVAGAPEVGEMVRGYLVWEAGAVFFYGAEFAAVGVCRGAGNTRVPMIASLLANVVNFGLNVVFIFGKLGAPRMGVEGAGLATMIASAFLAIFMVGYLLTPLSPVRIGLSSFRKVTREALGRLGRVVLPAALEPLILQGGLLVYLKWITLLGPVAMAAHRAALAVESLAFMSGYAFAVAGSAMVGQMLGAGRPDRAEQAMRETARMALLCMSAIGILFLAVPSALAGIFVSGPGAEEVVALAALCLGIAAIEQPFMALSMALGGALRGAGETRSPVGVAVVGVWLVRVPLAWGLAVGAGLGLPGIWLTMIADWAVRAALFGVRVRGGRWKTLRL